MAPIPIWNSYNHSRDVGAPEFGCHRFVRIRSIAGTRIANNVPLFGVEIEERTNEISRKALSG
jgi:hypothetical protein